MLWCSSKDDVHWHLWNEVFGLPLTTQRHKGSLELALLCHLFPWDTLSPRAQPFWVQAINGNDLPGSLFFSWVTCYFVFLSELQLTAQAQALSFLLLLKINLKSSYKERDTHTHGERKSESERGEISHLLVQPPNGHHSQGLARTKPGARNSIWVCHVGAGAQAVGPSSVAFSDTLAVS